MPDLSTFDNRNNAEINRIIGSKMKEHRNGNAPNNSMRNLNLIDENLPIYKRKASRKGPVKLTENSYSNKLTYDEQTFHRRNENRTTVESNNENLNEMNQK